MTDEQLVAAWLRMLNEQRSMYVHHALARRPVGFDLCLAGRQSVVVAVDKPITREHLIDRVEQLIQGQVNDRLQGT